MILVGVHIGGLKCLNHPVQTFEAGVGVCIGDALSNGLTDHITHVGSNFRIDEIEFKSKRKKWFYIETRVKLCRSEI